MHDDLKKVACETAVSAGHLVLEKWSQPRQIHEKKPRDFVTDADFAAQALITSKIREIFPSHGFLTEEEDNDLPKNGDIIWIIDPIDGTVNYSHQHPIYCVSSFENDISIAPSPRGTWVSWLATPMTATVPLRLFLLPHE